MRRLVLSALFVAFVLLLLSAYPVLGQMTPLAQGTPLRVHAYGLQLSGGFIRWDGDTLVMRPESAGPVVRADRATAASAIQRLDRGVPRSPGRGAARGALWGGIIGGVAGVVLGAATAGNCITCSNSTAEGALGGAAFLGGLGAGIGASIGVIAPGTAWEPISLREEGSS